MLQNEALITSQIETVSLLNIPIKMRLFIQISQLRLRLLNNMLLQVFMHLIGLYSYKAVKFAFAVCFATRFQIFSNNSQQTSVWEFDFFLMFNKLALDTELMKEQLAYQSRSQYKTIRTREQSDINTNAVVAFPVFSNLIHLSPTHRILIDCFKSSNSLVKIKKNCPCSIAINSLFEMLSAFVGF